jgi:AcrR family transcriptional regulator
VKPYHHGDLRAALIAAGLRLLAERAGGDLSLREVARAVGVSANAVYRHFPDKRALMGALALEGLTQLGAAQRAAAETAGGGVAGFNATGREYIRFAMQNPALFRLIFSSSEEPGLLSHSDSESSDAMRFLRANAAQFAPPGVDSSIFTLQAWSMVHGLAMLILDGRVPLDDTTIDAVFTEAPTQ